MIKAGVDLRGLQPQMVLAFFMIQTVYYRKGYVCTITSCSDGKHGPNSLHYSGKALDIRTRNVMPLDLPGIVKDIKESLGEQFDVVLEGDHIHVEFDPKDQAKNPEEA
jgi:hypothetical protein